MNKKFLFVLGVTGVLIAASILCYNNLFNKKGNVPSLQLPLNGDTYDISNSKLVFDKQLLQQETDYDIYNFKTNFSKTEANYILKKLKINLPIEEDNMQNRYVVRNKKNHFWLERYTGK